MIKRTVENGLKAFPVLGVVHEDIVVSDEAAVLTDAVSSGLPTARTGRAARSDSGSPVARPPRGAIEVTPPP